MTIRTRLWVSHLISLIVPIIMSLLILGIAILGLLFYIERGNYIYVEHLNQYNIARQILTSSTFHELKKEGTLNLSSDLYRLFDPDSTYIIVTKNSKIIDSYGNSKLLNAVDANILKNTVGVSSFSNGSTYYTSIQRILNGHNFRFVMVASNAVGVDDKKLEFFLKATLGGMLLFTILSIWVVNKFLTKFTMRHILKPLKALTKGAREVEAGNLEVHVDHNGDDEFKPITSRFNAMTESLHANALRREAEEKSRRELIAGISHDLRTPLTSIKAYVEGLIDGVAMNEDKRQKYLTTIQSKTNDIDKMLEQLFLFSKLDLGAAAIHTEPILLHEVIRDYVKDNYEDFLSRGLAISLNIQKSARINGDFSILIRIIENILTNSVKYKVKELGYSRISLSTTHSTAIITITDDGPGVAVDKLSRIFEVFYRTDKARANTKEGSGLGLAIAYKYMKLMGGTISATNVRPHGLQITITMPLINSKHS